MRINKKQPTDSDGKGSIFGHLISAFTSVRYRLNNLSNPLNSVLIDWVHFQLEKETSF